MCTLRSKYYPLNRIEISESALKANYAYLLRLSSVKIAPVLKSNAYGHGLVSVAQILDTVGAPFFCVDSLYEAYELSKNSIKTPILIMGYTNPDNLKVKKLPFSFAVYDKETLEVLNKYQPQAGIHIFVDAGMHREGIRMDELEKFLQYASQFKNNKIEGLMSHFGASEQYNNPLTKEQLKNFQKAQEMFLEAGFEQKWIHIGNSSAALHSKEYNGKIGNLIRTGISLYGIDPEGNDKKLVPCLQVKTTLNQIKYLRKGEQVGYDFTYTAKKDMKIGILPYGYYDGMDRRLSNNGFVSINGDFCPIIGRVSMNLTTIDISEVNNPSIGDRVVVYSNRRSDKNSFTNAALSVETIPYDLLVHLASSTKRVIV